MLTTPKALKYFSCGLLNADDKRETVFTGPTLKKVGQEAAQRINGIKRWTIYRKHHEFLWAGFDALL